MSTITLYLIFTSIGWILLIASLFSGHKTDQKSEDERTLTTGKVIAGKTEKRLQIRYRANGTDYIGQLPAEIPPDWIGRTIDVYYNPDKPSSFHIEEMQKKPKKGKLLWIGLIWIALGTALYLGFFSLFGMDGPFSRLLPFPARLQIYRMEMENHQWGIPIPKIPIKATPEPTAAPTPEPTVEPILEPLPEPVFECQYHLNDEGAVIEKISGARRRTMNIPDEVDGHPVVELEADALSEFLFLRHLILPGSMRVINKVPFQERVVFLHSITIGLGTERIESGAFALCRVLEKVEIPETVISIAEDAFRDDCSAVFFVVEGSEAERYCTEKGYNIQWVTIGSDN